MRKAGMRIAACILVTVLAVSCVCAPDEMENVVEDVLVASLPPSAPAAMAASVLPVGAASAQPPSAESAPAAPAPTSAIATSSESASPAGQGVGQDAGQVAVPASGVEQTPAVSASSAENLTTDAEAITPIPDASVPAPKVYPDPVLPDLSPGPGAIAISMAMSPMPFSPDADGLNDIVVFTPKVTAGAGVAEWTLAVFEDSPAGTRAKPFKEWKGSGELPYSFTWDGKDIAGRLVEAATDYVWSLSIVDRRGKDATLTGLMPVDVLVHKEGGRLKIRVPAIQFRPDRSDFAGLDPAEMAANTRIVSRISAYLEKFPSYSVSIEGHGNNVGKMSGHSASRIADEEAREVLPLSAARADFVRVLLSMNGVDPKRLTSLGLGSSVPLYDPRDAVRRSANRRVEFFLAGR